MGFIIYDNTDDMVREIENMIERIQEWEESGQANIDYTMELVNCLRAAQDRLDEIMPDPSR